MLDRAVPKSVSSIVPTSGWRIYTVGDSMPTFDPATFRLTVAGLVGSPTSFTLADLKAMPRADQVSDFHCVTGWSVSDVRWGGVRIADLLEAAGAKRAFTALSFVSAELPYEDSLTLKQALLPDVMLAYEMDGGPISRPHGAPVRLVMPQMYGYKSVKWVDRIELGTAAQPGLLGAERLRRRRVAREVEWLLFLSPRSRRPADRSEARRADRALHRHRARAALDARLGILRPARDRDDPLPARRCRR